MKSKMEEQGNIGTESDCHISSEQILPFSVLQWFGCHWLISPETEGSKLWKKKKKKRQDSQSCWEKSNQFGFWPHQAMKPKSFSKSLFINLKMWADFRKQWVPARSHSLQCKWLLGYSRSSQLLKISLSTCVTYKINSIGRCEASHKIKSIWPGIMHNLPILSLISSK